ncbi:MAG: hypothetical protein SFZ03_10210 [Candidatus Melainabacteria bacterium]|nr:hypothetical protein [Candidatus Melainabacteria bacterium]
MKQFLMTLLTAGLMASLPTLAEAKQYVIGLSPYNPRPVAEAQTMTMARFLVETMKPGDTADVYNAYAMSRIAHFSVPNHPAYKHPKAIFQVNVKSIQALRQSAAASHAPSGKGQPAVQGAILQPQFLRMIGNNRRNAAPLDIIIIGNPLYDEPQSKAFSMAGGNVPGTGHLKHSVATTVYGIDNPKLLQNTRVHLIYSGSWARHNQHQYHVHAFWNEFIRRQSGTLVSFGSDLNANLERVKTNSPAIPTRFDLPPSNRLDMFYYAPPVLQKGFFETPAIQGEPPKTAVLQNPALGIKWDCKGCDIDLYVRPARNAPVLYYAKTSSTAGKYNKDVINAPVNGYETVNLIGDFPVKDTFIAVNFYGGSSPGGVRGEFRVQSGKQTYAKPFHITAGQGNAGVGREQTLQTGKPASPHWVVLSL